MTHHTNLRSLLSFLVITIFASLATIFIIEKTQRGIDEIEQISESPQVAARREFIRELLPSGTASEWRLYQSTQYGFELFYPPDYHITQSALMSDSPFVELVIGDENATDILSIRVAAKNKSQLMTSRGEWISGPCTGGELSSVESKSEKKFRTHPARVLTGVLAVGESAGREVSYTCVQSPRSSLIASYLRENHSLASPIFDTIRFIK